MYNVAVDTAFSMRVIDPKTQRTEHRVNKNKGFIQLKK